MSVRRQVGVVLRAPIVAALATVWICCIWFWYVLLVAAIAAAHLIILPLAYWPLFGLGWIAAAFGNSDEPILPEYWKEYPAKIFDGVVTAAKLGFPTLKRWLFQGFSD